MRKFIFMLAVLVIFPALLFAKNTVSFNTLWNQIEGQSPDIKATQSDLKATQMAKDRQALHWLPKVSIAAKAYSTNNPAATFVGNLNQRSVTAADFNPATLNQPGQSFYQQGSVGIDLPVFEGGANVAATKSLKKMSDAKNHMLKSTRLALFSETTVAYSLLLSALREKSQTQNILAFVEDLLQNYTLGTSTNPVGHSGLLGLKSLRHQLLSLGNQSNAKISALKQTLALRAHLDHDWNPVFQDVISFLQKNLGAAQSLQEKDENPQYVKAGYSFAAAQNHMADTELAKLLPKIGLFGEADVTHGSRNTATSTTLGGYMQWMIFSPTEWMAKKQKKTEAQVLYAKADSEALKARTESGNSYFTIQATIKNLRLMNQSLALSNQQIEGTKSLYQSGVVNILQLTEVLNRHADLISHINEAEELLATESAKNYVLRGGKNDE